MAGTASPLPFLGSFANAIVYRIKRGAQLPHWMPGHPRREISNLSDPLEVPAYIRLASCVDLTGPFGSVWSPRSILRTRGTHILP